FRKAALAGNAIAQNRYARVLSVGRGAPQNKVAAAAWHMLAKAQGLGDPYLDGVVDSLSPEDRKKAEDVAHKWIALTPNAVQP
ncbi:MAG: hypothetical protein B7Y12_23755, partial [Rhizobiales bacterium 24-66-13]